jgi:hypothetical protein
MNAIDEARKRTRKERTDRMYAEVLATSPTLYEHAVSIASTTPGLELEQRAALEGRIMGLVLAAFRECPTDWPSGERKP